MIEDYLIIILMELSAQFDGELILGQSLQDRAELSAVPAKRGVYVLFAADSRPINAMIAADMRSSLAGRLISDDQQASRRADLSEIAASVKWIRCDSRFECDVVHLQIIRRLWPDDYADKLPRRRAWFVAASDTDSIPYLATVSRCDFSKAATKYFGPFMTSSQADQYIELLTDLFDLCRHNSILRRAPKGQKCPYAQMDRCNAPCDGSMEMREYRKFVGRATDFILGSEESITDELTALMLNAAAATEFERAAVYRGRLESAEKLQDKKFAEVRDARTLALVIAQRSAKKNYIRLFSFAGGRIGFFADVQADIPQDDLQQLLDGLCDRAAQAGCGDCDDHLLAIITHYLFSTNDYAGVFAHLDDQAVSNFAARLANDPKLTPAEKSDDAANLEGDGQ